MKYENMLWAGFREVSDFASKWRLSSECRAELAAAFQAEYNAGANDVLEYLKLEAPVKKEAEV